MSDVTDNPRSTGNVPSLQSVPYKPVLDLPKLKGTPVDMGKTTLQYSNEYIEAFNKIANGEDRSIWEIIKWLLSQSDTIIRIIKQLITIQERIKMGDTKTTILGIVKGVILVLTLIGVNIDSSDADVITSGAMAIYAVVEVIQGWFAKDKTKEEKKNV